MLWSVDEEELFRVYLGSVKMMQQFEYRARCSSGWQCLGKHGVHVCVCVCAHVCTENAKIQLSTCLFFCISVESRRETVFLMSLIL